MEKEQTIMECRGTTRSRSDATKLRAWLTALLLAVPGTAVLAQDPPPSGESCQAPADPTPGGAKGESADRGLAQKLDHCHGVLKAPSVGDSDMVTPAPSTGSERVIKPDTLPQGTNSSNGSGG
jgi:hypothetical protein